MATKPVRNVAYSLGAPLTNMAPQPIVAQRDPTGTDQAEIGTIWVNTESSTVFILASITAGASDWTSSSGSGAGTFTSVTINPGNLHLTGVGGSIVVDDGDLTLTSGDVSIGGDLTMTGDLAVTGNVSISGGFTLDDTGSIVLTSTDNASGAISLITNGGTAETLLIKSEQGTGTSSVDIVSLAGGVTVNAGLSAASAIVLDASGTAGGILIESGTNGIANTSTGAVSLSTTKNAASAVLINANGGTSETVLIRSQQGTGATSVDLVSTAGGITLNGGLASASAINLTASNSAGGVTVTTGTAGYVSSSTGKISLTSTDNAAGAITIAANGGTSETVLIEAEQGTGATSVNVVSTAGGITLNGGLASASAINLTASAGAGGITASAGTGGIALGATNGTVAITSGTGAINIGTDAAAHTVTIGNITSTTGVTVNVGTGALNLGTSATAHATNVGSTTAGSSLVLNTPTGTKVTAANGVSITTSGVGLSLPGSVQVLSGAGSPNGSITAAAGSLFLRTDPAGATSRAYINTDSGTTWTNITCAA